MNEITFDGGAVKALGDGKVGGYLVRFSTDQDPDLVNDFFTKSTDFFIEEDTRVVVIYDHGQDEVLKARKLGKGQLKVDAVGVWIETQLNRRDGYEKAIYELAKKGKLGWSSGSLSHLVERKPEGKANRILTWPIGEASLTPNPAEYRNQAVSLKSIIFEEDIYFDAEPVAGEPHQTFQQHSETVEAAVEEFAMKANEVNEQVNQYVIRVRNRLEFREAKDGRTISQPNRQKLAQNKERLKSAMATMQQVHDDLESLMMMAEPKPKDKQNGSTPMTMGKSVEMSAEEIEKETLKEAAKFEELQFNLTAKSRK